MATSAGDSIAAYCAGNMECPPKQNIALPTAAIVPAAPVEKVVVLSGGVDAAAALAPPMYSSSATCSSTTASESKEK